MAATTKKKATRKKPQQKKKTGGIPNLRGLYYLSAGLILGLVAAGLLYLKIQGPNIQPSAKAPKIPMKSTAHQQNPHLDKPKFDFYTMLPKMKVAVPGEQNSNNNEVNTPTTQSQPTSQNKQYLLQVASFRNSKDADKLKATLLLNGFDVEVQQATINGQQWNRVYIGPYKQLQTAQKDQKRLQQQNISSIVVAMK